MAFSPSDPSVSQFLQRLRDLLAEDQQAPLSPDGEPADQLDQLLDTIAGQLRDKRAIEEQLIHSQKLEMLGLLANCVAHDFNNLLGAITNALDLIGQEADAEEQGQDVDWATVRTSLVALRNCADRGRDTVRQMLTFAKDREQDEQRQLDLNDVLTATEQMCRYSLDKRIAVNVLGYPGGAWVTGSLSQLQQALMNLCLNAQDAMPEGGHIELSADRIEADGDTPTRFILSVKDSGTGMDPAAARQIFDPFFTTKDHGTGLGLVVVKRIIDKHQGSIEVQSSPGQGTEFRLELPAAPQQQREPQGAANDSGLRRAQDGECILLVDDEEAIRKLNLRMLGKLGYDTLAAATGQQAIELFRQHHDRIDLVLLDLMLDDMTGVEVFQQLQQLQPGVKVLIISGFSQDPRIAQLLVAGCEGFLKKPYRLGELSDTFRDILDA